MKTAPIIRTERLLLREPILADWPSFAEVMTSDRARHMGGPFSIEYAWGAFCHGIALWQLFGVGNLSIELRATQQCIGQIEINQGPRFPEPELGWQLQSEAEGKGYAYEAAIALRDWAFRERKLDTLVSYIGRENSRSIRLAERLGATLDAHARPQDPGDLVYRHVPLHR
ncbi:GNAT family N-acetyltransferase [Pararhodobacter sp. SW119]|uniref:GNAT family N-acetyltransferase n=1 Tax=Pararhodobacter sp. SW119 TaxID=2780075 RepID=UPI001AE07464|nr:GNAT family N-acetyltransferase [Pararhodobacter sp. SW119]